MPISPEMLILGLIGLAAIILVFGVSQLLATPRNNAEDRLKKVISAQKAPQGPKASAISVVKQEMMPSDNPLLKMLPKLDSIADLYEQAHLGIPFTNFLVIVAALMALPMVVYLATTMLGYAGILPFYVFPIASVLFGVMSIAFLNYMKKKRINDFTAAMPEALELTGRALRAGHGLGSGLKMVADEMTGPIAEEFGRVFEEQNLGIPMEEALRAMANRIPTMDVRFFVTAVVIQRQTGGDLGEVLDKISHLIRQRFEIKGQVAALTGEGRLSGAVLLAMPPLLLLYLFMTNRPYVMPLFTDPELGQPMLIGAAVLQILGALAIRKIVDIKV